MKSPALSYAPLLVLLMSSVGCFAPGERLTFPTRPLRTTAHETWYDVNCDGKPDFATHSDDAGAIIELWYDDDEDGTPDRVYRLADYANETVPHFVVLLDSIPFQGVAERYAKGDFRWFDPPATIIPPFPTLTEVCYTELIHAPPLPGVMDTSYDRRVDARRSGLWDRAFGYEQPWEQRLAYHSKFYEQGLGYLNPRPWYAAELVRARQALDDSPDRVTIVYVTTASAMMSKYGRAGMDEILDGARQLCLQILYERHGAVKISMMADHGHNLMASKFISLEEPLTAAGFHPAAHLHRPNDVVLEVNGLITFAGIRTTQPAKVAAELMQRCPQLECAAYMDGDRAIVRDATGAAAIDRRGERFRYRPIDRDVLDLSPVVASLTAQGKADGDGFIAPGDWFAATVDHAWPDAPRRLWRTFHEQVVDPPDVMLCVRDGYCTGDASFTKYIKMASTHGGLNQINSATFLLTMSHRRAPVKRDGLPDSLPTAEVMQTIEPDFVPRVRR